MDVFLGVSYNNAEEEMAVIESFHRRRVEGIITASSRLTDDQLDQLARIGAPVVLINRQSEGEDSRTSIPALCRRWTTTPARARRSAHLLGLGHTAIAYLGATNRPRSNRSGARATETPCGAAGIAAQDGWIQEAPPERRSAIPTTWRTARS